MQRWVGFGCIATNYCKSVCTLQEIIRVVHEGRGRNLFSDVLKISRFRNWVLSWSPMRCSITSQYKAQRAYENHEDAKGPDAKRWRPHASARPSSRDFPGTCRVRRISCRTSFINEIQCTCSTFTIIIARNLRFPEKRCIPINML